MYFVSEGGEIAAIHQYKQLTCQQDKKENQEKNRIKNLKKERKKETPLGPDQRETEPQGSSFL